MASREDNGKEVKCEFEQNYNQNGVEFQASTTGKVDIAVNCKLFESYIGDIDRFSRSNVCMLRFQCLFKRLSKRNLQGLLGMVSFTQYPARVSSASSHKGTFNKLLRC